MTNNEDGSQEDSFSREPTSPLLPGAHAHTVPNSRPKSFLEALQSDGTDAKIARADDIHPVRLSNWKKMLNESGTKAFGGDDPLKDKEETIADLDRGGLQDAVEGYTNKEVGDKLYFSDRTVDKHRERIKDRLEVRNAVEMVTVALRRELISNPSSR